MVKSVPPFDGLFHGDFAVAVADQNQRGSLHRFDEVHGIAFGVDGGIVIDRCAEKWNHPLVDIVDAVIAQPIGESGARNRCREAMGLSLGPHGHVSAITVAADAEAIGIDGILLGNGVNAGHDVAKVAAAEIFYVALREGFALTVTAARIGAEGRSIPSLKAGPGRRARPSAARMQRMVRHAR